MSQALAGAIAGALLMCAGIVGMAAMSHCPRRWRIWPSMLLALGALYASDRALELFAASGYLHDVRALVVIATMASVLGTVCKMAWMIHTACPMCVRQKRHAHGVAHMHPGT